MTREGGGGLHTPVKKRGGDGDFILATHLAEQDQDKPTQGWGTKTKAALYSLYGDGDLCALRRLPCRGGVGSGV